MRKSSPMSPSPLTEAHGLGYPRLFHWLTLLLVAVILLVAAVQHIIALLLFSIFVLVLGSVAWLWSHLATDGLVASISLARDRAFPGETAELVLEITNSKWLPLTWMEIEVETPYKLAHGRQSLSPYTRERLRWTTALRGGQTVTWRHAVRYQARGEYCLGPVRLHAGDVFGLFPREILFATFTPLLVYPRVVPVDKLSLPIQQLTGERGIPRNIYEDSSRLMGVRDYQPDDPLKSIHWKATARQGRLQTRLYESTTSQSFLFILDVHSFCASGNEDDFELAVTAVASLAYEASRETCSIGLIASSQPVVHIPAATGHRQLLAILEALARVRLQSETPVHEVLQEDRMRLPIGATPVVVTSVSDSLFILLRKLARANHSPVVLNVGVDKPRQVPPGIPVITIRSPGDLSRRYDEVK